MSLVIERLDELHGHRARTQQLLEVLGPPVSRLGHTREQWTALVAMPLERDRIICDP